MKIILRLFLFYAEKKKCEINLDQLSIIRVENTHGGESNIEKQDYSFAYWGFICLILLNNNIVFGFYECSYGEVWPSRSRCQYYAS